MRDWFNYIPVQKLPNLVPIPDVALIRCFNCIFDLHELNGIKQKSPCTRKHLIIRHFANLKRRGYMSKWKGEKWWGCNKKRKAAKRVKLEKRKSTEGFDGAAITHHYCIRDSLLLLMLLLLRLILLLMWLLVLQLFLRRLAQSSCHFPRTPAHPITKNYPKLIVMITKVITFSSEKVLDLCKMWPPRFCQMSSFWDPLNPKKWFLRMCLSVCLCVCVSVDF